MKRKFVRLAAMIMVCCLISGTVAYAEDPEVTASQTEDLHNGENDVTTVTDSPQSGSSESEEPENGSSGSEGPENGTSDGLGGVIASDSSEGERTGESDSSEGGGTEENTGEKETASTSATTPAQSVKPVPKSKKIRVLLVGNSLTYTKGNTSVNDLKMLAKKAGRKLVVKYLTYSDEKLKNWANPKHKNGKRLYREIRSKRWDYVIFQEQTSAAVTNSFYKAGKKISGYVHATSPKTKVLYNCTWAYKKGKRVQGKFYSFKNMQNRMNENYGRVSRETGDRVCWSGKAFLKYRKRKGSVNLYRKDNNHASRYGWYLNACCMYASIFGVSPRESKYYAGLNKKRAKVMQKIAAEVNLY